MRHAATAALLAAVLLAPAASATILNSGEVRVGLDPGPGGAIGAAGVHVPTWGSGTTDVGLRLVTSSGAGYEALTTNGGHQGGWGLGFDDAHGGAAGHCQQSGGACPGGDHEADPLLCQGGTCLQASRIGTPAAPPVEVRHAWSPHLAGVVAVDIEVENQGPDARSNVTYRRVIDWRNDPTPQNGFVEAGGVLPMPAALRFLGADGQGPADPRLPLSGGCAAPLTYIGPGTCARGDHGLAVEFDLGTLAPGAKTGLCMFLGAARDRQAALLLLDQLPVEVYGLAYTASDGRPATFFVGFGCLSPPEAAFSFSPPIACAGSGPEAAVRFEDQSTQPTSLPLDIAWSFGDGTGRTASGGIVHHVFQEPGLYPVSLRATGPGGNATVTHSIPVVDCLAPPPPRLLEVPERYAEEGEKVTFAVRAEAADGVVLRFSGHGLPEGASVDPDTGAFAWTASEPGRHCMVLRVEEEHEPRRFDQTPTCITVFEASTVIPIEGRETCPGCLDEEPGPAEPTDNVKETVGPTVAADDVALSCPDCREAVEGQAIEEDDEPAITTGSLEGPMAAVPRTASPWPLGLLAALALVGGALWLRERRRPLPPVAPLFTRLKRNDLLDHPVRQRILDLVEAEPGLHYRALVRGVDKGKGTVEYHLRILEDNGFVRAHRSGGYVTYYPAGHDRQSMAAQSVLRSETARRVLQELLGSPGITLAQLAERLDMSYGAVSHHVKRFEEADLVSLDRVPGGARAMPTAQAWQAIGPQEVAVA